MRVRTLHDPPVFVTIEEAARRCMIGVEKFRSLVQTGTVPPAALNHGQTIRWHWPSVEAALAGHLEAREDDPFMKGLANVKTTPRRGRGAVAA